MLIQANANQTPLADKSAHLIVCSPPYYSKRDYNLPPQIYGGRSDCEHSWGEEIIQRQRGVAVGKNAKIDHAPRSGVAVNQGQFCRHCAAWVGSIGLEPTIELFIQHLIEVFRECWRVLRDDGVMFINIGDSYAGSSPGVTEMQPVTWSENGSVKKAGMTRAGPVPGLKAKNLCLIPDHLRIALQKDGWIIRSKIIWHKPNPMPESATDRPTVDYEDVIMVTKQGRYFWDQQAVREKNAGAYTEMPQNGAGAEGVRKAPPEQDNMSINKAAARKYNGSGRNLRTVWTIPTESYSGAHFATFPKKLVATPILGGTSSYGVCGACGAQWVRVVEKKFIPQPNVSLERGKKGAPGQKPLSDNPNPGWDGVQRGSNRTKTTGWEPSCGCYPRTHNTRKRFHQDVAGTWLPRALKRTKPAVVFDPFAGTGTTGQVAREAGRRFVGLDLSEKYLALAMVRAEKKTPQSKIDEMPLFAFAGLKGEL